MNQASSQAEKYSRLMIADTRAFNESQYSIRLDD